MEERIIKWMGQGFLREEVRTENLKEPFSVSVMVT